jgi:hypothetical protein
MTRLLTSLLWLGPTAALACDFPSSNTDLLTALDAATTAFGALEIEAFQEAHSEAAQHVDCLAEPLSRSTAAQFHRVAGLAAFLERRSDDATASFAAARLIEPAYLFPVDLVPTGNPILQAYEARDPKASPTEPVAAPAVGSVTIDASSVLLRRAQHPTIVQQLDGRGAVVDTWLLGPGEPMPAMAPPPPATPADATASTDPKRSLLRPVLRIAAGSTLALAGGLTAAGAASRGAWSDATSVADADRARATTNALVLGAGVAGVAGLGLGAGSFAVAGSR